MLANRLVPKLFASKLAPTKSGGVEWVAFGVVGVNRFVPKLFASKLAPTKSGGR
ncbi:hypothetical protein [Pseudomonas citronellolis]|uniref:hypothetical protein n=1 Tax=Pseudomonas citronellolis TaxID=53408 RepID=UPI0014367448|nr:hypothetical protein [Pseudomonas citronellolis]